MLAVVKSLDLKGHTVNISRSITALSLISTDFDSPVQHTDDSLPPSADVVVRHPLEESGSSLARRRPWRGP